MAEARPSGTVTFLFTDIEGSTRAWERDDAAMAAALELHDQILRQSISAHDGYVFSTAGDAFGAAFTSCAEAAAAARSAQAELAATRWPTPEPLQIRIGLHVGEAYERDGDYFGPTLNRAARIMAAAHGGQTLTSAAVSELLGAEDVLRDLGRHRLKDLSSPEHIWQLGTGDFPPPRTLEALHHNLPVERTPLVGRGDEIARLDELLAAHRLVTVLGIGGTGKTRLATATAAEVAERFPDGVWFVDLIPVSDAAGVAAAIGTVTGLQIPGSDLIVGLATALAERRVLLIMDNCEHVTDDVASVVDELLARTTAPRFLATSREPLELFDEAQLGLEPLSVADDYSPAVQLFVETAERVGQQLTNDDMGAVVDICGHLDGHPLSIELAAAQLKQLSVGQLAERLDHRFELLARGHRGRRHESLVAILDDTWSMLDRAEQAMLLQLAAFPSVFAIEDAEGVCADLDVGLPSRTLGGLADRSLVADAGAGRHRLLETVKLFGRRRWEDDEPLERHERWLRDHVSAQPPQARYTSNEFAGWLWDHIDDWHAIERRMSAAGRWGDLGELYLQSHRLFAMVESTPWAIEALDRIEDHLDTTTGSDTACEAALNLTAAQLALPIRRPDWIERGSTRALELLRERGGIDFAYALILGSWMLVFREPDAALEMLTESVELAETSGAPGVADVALGYRAIYLALAGRREEARDVLDELRARTADDIDTYGKAMHDYASSAVKMTSDAEAATKSALALMELGDGPAIIAATTLAASGDLITAQRLYDLGVANVERIFGDDGLPDLLLPAAAAAYAVGATDRARRLLSAIRASPKPTQNFMTTIQYRELRNEVGLSEENPLDSRSMDEIFDDARAWMAGVTASGVT